MIGPLALESSAIHRVIYDPSAAVLYVEFKSSQSVYSYAGIDRPLFEALINAGSVGQYFHHQIKKRFQHQQVSSDVWSELLDRAARLSVIMDPEHMRAATTEWLNAISDDVLSMKF